MADSRPQILEAFLANHTTEVQRGTPAMLVLADGRTFSGSAIGRAGQTCGELVFNTAMTGYQEILTDPSYRHQLVTMTYPHIGNYGVQPNDGESGKPQVAGLIVRKLARRFSHRGATISLGQYLANHGVVGIEGIDTRALVRHIRDHGAQPAVIATGADLSASALADNAAAWGERMDWDVASIAGAGRPYVLEAGENVAVRGTAPTIVAYDFGIKDAITNQLAALGCRVVVVPPSFPAHAIKAMNPSGIFVSNGPGDPSQLSDSVATVRELLGVAPMFGICLGHQLLGQALGGTVDKMRFGHRGGNHPVLDLAADVVEITSQNHGYTLVADSLPSSVQITHKNLNDGTVEGIAAPALEAFSIQYHPEASPGPHDAHRHFLKFAAAVHAHAQG